MEWFIIWIVWVVILGIITGAIANSKGLNFWTWMLFGMMIFIVALPCVLVAHRRDEVLDRRRLAGGRSKACPHCAEVIKREAAVCRFCGRDVAPVAG